eukprot:jgi/Phyca11/17688/fgenesh1_pg.PHYCAscaffold_29_\
MGGHEHHHKSSRSGAWEGNDKLKKALEGLATAKGVSQSRIASVAKLAAHYSKFYKHVVHDIEMFLWKAEPEHRLAGLYAIDAIIRQAHAKNPKDAYVKRFLIRLSDTVVAVKKVPEQFQPKVRHVIEEWVKRGIYTTKQIEDVGGREYLSTGQACTRPSGNLFRRKPYGNGRKGDSSVSYANAAAPSANGRRLPPDHQAVPTAPQGYPGNFASASSPYGTTNQAMPYVSREQGQSRVPSHAPVLPSPGPGSQSYAAPAVSTKVVADDDEVDTAEPEFTLDMYPTGGNILEIYNLLDRLKPFEDLLPVWMRNYTLPYNLSVEGELAVSGEDELRKLAVRHLVRSGQNRPETYSKEKFRIAHTFVNSFFENPEDVEYIEYPKDKVESFDIALYHHKHHWCSITSKTFIRSLEYLDDLEQFYWIGGGYKINYEMASSY